MTNINTFQGDVFIHEYIKHSGDENNLFGFSGTDTFKIATGGTDAIKVDASQNVDITGVIRHIGDENNLFGFSGTDTFKIATAGADRLTVGSNGTVTLGVNMEIPDYIHHVGDSNNYFGFSAADTFKIVTAGTDRLTVAANGTVTLGVNMAIPDYIYHAGESDTYFGFSAADTIVMRTAGADRLTIGSSGTVTVGVNMAIPNYIYHTGDLDTYFGFSAANTIVMRTGGTDRLTVNSSGTVTLASGLSTSVTPGTYLTGSAYNGATARTFAVDATTAATASKVVARDTSADILARLFRSNYGNQSTISGALAYRISTSDNYIRFCSDAAAIRTFIGCLASNGTAATATKVQVTRDDTGDTAMYLTMAPNNTAGQKDLYMDTNLLYDNTNNRLRLKQVMFGDQNVYGLGAVAGQYGSVGTVGTGKGSYEGLNINGQWVIGMTNGASMCGIYNDTDNEWAAKFNQNGSTDLYYNNGNKLQTTNTGVHVSGDVYADHMYIDDYIYHNGDTNTRIGFATDTIYMRTSGVDRLTITSSGVTYVSGITSARSSMYMDGSWRTLLTMPAGMGIHVAVSTKGAGGTYCFIVGNRDDGWAQVTAGNNIQVNVSGTALRVGSSNNGGYTVYWNAIYFPYT
jgi:hypothetical protein